MSAPQLAADLAAFYNSKAADFAPLAITAKKAYQASLNAEEYEPDTIKITTAPAAFNPQRIQRGRATSEKSRTISVTIIGAAEVSQDADDNDVFNDDIIDRFVDLVEKLADLAGMENDEIIVSEIQDADYIDPLYLEQIHLLATTLNITYKEFEP